MQKRRNLNRCRLAVILLNPLVSEATCGRAAAQEQLGNEHKLTPSEVKSLIKSAKTPEDHLMLAKYFREEAAEEEAAAKFHDEMAQLYQPNPAPSKRKQPSVAEMKRHCEYFARNARKAAKAAMAISEYHEQLAKLLRNPPPERSRVGR